MFEKAMSTGTPDFWQRANQAREKLSLQLSGQPEVSLVDLGLNPNDPAGSEEIFLRVHLRHAAEIHRLDLPLEVDGLPVIVIIADYRLE
jgi:hypothetical protein